jgi:hypothetical protein
VTSLTMKFLRKVVSSADFWPLFIVVVFAVLAGRHLLTSGYFNMHDDLQMMRQLEMEKCFKDLQIPCRWVPDMGYGFGFPLFNYYPPLPYLIGEVFRLVGFSFVDTVKIVFLLSFVVSGVTMYLLAKEFFGPIMLNLPAGKAGLRGVSVSLGAVVSSIFYIWAPYHAVDVFVRGAMNEAWALSWFPLILWAGYRLVSDEKNAKKWTVALALSFVALLLSHNLMAMIFAPIFAGWLLIWIIKSRKLIFNIKYLVLSGFLTLGLSAFFTLPAIFEQKYVQVNTLVTGYYEYVAHFASIGQLLFSRFWGYGPSIWGTNDGMSFQVGHVHWILSLVIIIIIFIKLIKQRKSLPLSLIAISYSLVFAWLAVFMAHPRSTPLWQVIPLLRFVQFPWRFLSLAILGFSFAAGAIAVLLPKKLAVTLSLTLILILTVLNWNYFKPEHMGPLTDKEKFSGAAWELQQTAGIYDYLPIGAITAPKEPMKNLAEFMDGRGKIANPQEGTNWASFEATVSGDKAILRLGIFAFPNWKTYIDGKEVASYIAKDEMWGRIYIEVPGGSHTVKVKLANTALRGISNAVSLTAWVLLVSLFVWKKRQNA